MPKTTFFLVFYWYAFIVRRNVRFRSKILKRCPNPEFKLATRFWYNPKTWLNWLPKVKSKKSLQKMTWLNCRFFYYVKEVYTGWKRTFESALSAILLALFLLAIHRRFRRWMSKKKERLHFLFFLCGSGSSFERLYCEIFLRNLTFHLMKKPLR